MISARFGLSSLTYNFHLCCHLPEFVNLYQDGTMGWSTYPYESANHVIRLYMHGYSSGLKELAKRQDVLTFLWENRQKMTNYWAVSHYVSNLLFNLRKIELMWIIHAKFNNKIRILSAICTLITRWLHQPLPPLI